MSDSLTSIERVGYFNHSHGIFVEKNYGTYNFVIRNGYGEENRIAQTNWNERQLLTGNTILDLTKTNIFWTDIEWLGVGDVRCGFIIDGVTYTCHKFHHSNMFLAAYMKSAVLPIRYEITEYGNITKTLKQICSSIHSEGGYELKSIPRSIGNYTKTEVDTSELSLLSIRIKPEYIWDRVITLSSVSFYVTGVNNRGIYYKIVSGTSIPNNVTWVDMPDNVNSVVQYSLDTSFTTQKLIHTKFVDTGSTVDLKPSDLTVQIGRSIDGIGEVISIIACSMLGIVNCSVTLEWYES